MIYVKYIHKKIFSQFREKSSKKVFISQQNVLYLYYNNKTEIIMENLKSAIVKYKGGFYRVSADKGQGEKRWVNLKSIFGNTIYYKQVPAAEVVKAEQEWHAGWIQTESYQSM